MRLKNLTQFIFSTTFKSETKNVNINFKTMNKSDIASIGLIAIAVVIVLRTIFMKQEAIISTVDDNKATVSGDVKIEINKTKVVADGKDYAYISLTLYDNQRNPILGSHIVVTSNRGAKDFLYGSINGSVRSNTDLGGHGFFSVSSKTEGVSKISIKGKNIDEVNQEITFIKPKSDDLLKIYPNGTLMRFSVYPRIWRIIGGKKYIVPTVNVFNVYGFDWNKVVTEYNPDIIDAYPDVDLVMEKEGTKVYQLVGCLGRNCNGPTRKHWIPSTELFAGYELSQDEIVEVSKEEIDSYPRISLITVSDSNDIYYLTEEGQKRLIPSPEIFASHEYDWRDVLFISNDELIKYPKGEPIE